MRNYFRSDQSPPVRVAVSAHTVRLRSAARYRLLRRRVPRTREPHAALLVYRRALRALMAEVRREVVAALAPVVRAVAVDAGEVEVAGLRVRLHRVVEARVPPAAEDAFGHVDRSSSEDVVAQFRVLEVDVLRRVPRVAARLPAFVQKNVDLIHSVVGEELRQVQAEVARAVPLGLRVEELTRRILDRADVAESRAELIARDQVLKLHGDVTRDRQTGLGVRRYRWSTSNDERVRPVHAELEGTEQSWDEPPVVSEDGRREHPGGDYQCRCVAVPLFDEDAATEAETE
jgi:SPP1 gp7 family putative phage head morphogenesis protein